LKGAGFSDKIFLVNLQIRSEDMAEIKSAVELAMEKTKDLHLSRAEMEQFKEDEIKSKAQGLANRFLEVDFHFKEVEKELSKWSPEERRVVENLMLQNFCGAITLDGDNDLIFQGIEALRKDGQGFTRQIQELMKEYRRQRAKAHRETEKNLLAQFAKQGISGSAVQAKVEVSPDWEGALARFKPAFEEKLRALQEELKK
jgi:hypothetical protein